MLICARGLMCTRMGTYAQCLLARGASMLGWLPRSLALRIPYGAFVRRHQICVSTHCHCLSGSERWSLPQSASVPHTPASPIDQGRYPMSVVPAVPCSRVSASLPCPSSWRGLTKQATSQARKHLSEDILFIIRLERERPRRCARNDEQFPCPSRGEGQSQCQWL